MYILRGQTLQNILPKSWPTCKGQVFNKLRLRQNGHHFPDNTFKWIFVNEKVWISIKISLKYIPSGPINNIPISLWIMAWCQPIMAPNSRRASSHKASEFTADYRSLQYKTDKIEFHSSKFHLISPKKVQGQNITENWVLKIYTGMIKQYWIIFIYQWDPNCKMSTS